ncbi:MAG TPA: alpha/beta fold hydrolase [Actinomycetota bacterium]|jgi:polyhydroxyalkanoate synthase
MADQTAEFRAQLERQLEAQLGAGMEAFQRLLPSGLVGAIDPAALGAALGQATGSLALQPLRMLTLWTRYVSQTTQATMAATARLFGIQATGPLEPRRGDRRFKHPDWQANPWYYLLQQRHLLLEGLADDLVAAADVDEGTRRKAGFALKQLVDAAAPTNQLWGNPAAIRRAYETGGQSLVKGLATFLDDVAGQRGPQKVPEDALQVGKDLAVTPGKVVFRNQLMELIQYEPQTDAVHETPLLLSPPWINKYYIMDLAPGRSLVEWAVKHGHTVFTASYKNPDASMRDVRLDDYLVSGPRAALDVVEDVTGARQVNMVGLCLGGTLTAILAAWLAAVGDRRVRSATLLNTLLDYSDPGVLGIMTDPETVAKLEREMAETGFLEAEKMATTFDLLRANDLVWNYVVNNWLMGEEPASFDILTWNNDATRMPAGMHSFYLRSCYIENQLAKGTMELAGQRLDLGKVTEDVYMVAAEQDHITPWRSCYKGARLLGGTVRFVLSNSGHIAGVVNPPNPKSRHWVGRNARGRFLPADPDRWRANASEHEATWWEDWTEWIAKRGGSLRPPPAMGSAGHPPLADAPGGYVLDR